METLPDATPPCRKNKKKSLLVSQSSPSTRLQRGCLARPARAWRRSRSARPSTLKSRHCRRGSSFNFKEERKEERRGDWLEEKKKSENSFFPPSLKNNFRSAFVSLLSFFVSCSLLFSLSERPFALSLILLLSLALSSNQDGGVPPRGREDEAAAGG